VIVPVIVPVRLDRLYSRHKSFRGESMRNPVLAMFSIFLVAMAAAPAVGQTDAAPTPSDGYFYKSEPVADHVHLIYRPDPVRLPAEGNVEVIEQTDGLVVVDAGGTPEGGTRVVEEIRRISSKPVKYLIYTHWHYDHTLGAPAFRAAYPGIRIISTDATRADMTGAPMRGVDAMADAWRGNVAQIAHRLASPDGLDAEQLRRYAQAEVDAPLIAKAYDGATAVPADITFSDKLDLPDAVAPVEVMFLGKAHTDGDAVVWLPQQKVVVTGDVVVLPYPFGTDSYPQSWLAVLHRIESIGFTVLVPGHGEVQHDHRYLDKLIALIEDVQSQVDPAARQGKTLDDISKKVDFGNEYANFAGDSHWLHNAFKVNFLDPMVKNAYLEVRGEPISQNPGG
jgi:glyoxylase-like metal-dependent hydrolase (beta-lactamase superfamily II)